MSPEEIKQIYPNILNTQFSLQDDGSGPYIKDWSYPWPKPTDSEIAAVAPVVSFQAIVKRFDAAIEAHLHTEATAHGYTNIERACMYAPVPNPYEAESRSFVEWVGAVWAYCYAALLEVQSGIRPMPTIEQIISELPHRVIPS